jgi:hypothetical protein
MVGLTSVLIFFMLIKRIINLLGLMNKNYQNYAKMAVCERYVDSLQDRKVDLECVICLKTMDQSKVLQCQHTFHKSCLTQWFMTANKCPCCR